MRTFAMAAAVAALAALTPSGIARADVTVRSGEHPGHSRLVFEFDALPAWHLDPEDDGYVLRFDPPQPRVTFRDIFYYIPRTRLTALDHDPETGAIHIRLDCACNVESSVMRSRVLVLDIHDPDERNAAGDIVTMVDGPIFLVAEPDDPSPAAPRSLAAPTFPALPDPLPEIPALPFARDLAAEGVPMPGGLTRALAEMMARAAAQGMVEAEDDIPAADHTPGTGAPDDRPAPENIRIRTGLDEALAPSVRTDLPPLSSDLACPDPALYAVSAWGDDRPAHRQIGELRSRLVGEFDRPDLAAALALARLYIHLSFGTEARAVIDQFLPDHPDADLLRALSRVVEAGDAGGALAPLSGCAGSLPLWAFLDEDPGASKRQVDAQPVLLAFSGLPPHLRRQLGYRVATGFAARSDYSSAEVVRAALERITGADDPALLLSSTRTRDVSALDASASTALDRLAMSLHPEAAEALRINIEARLARNEDIPRDLADTADAMAHEMEGSGNGIGLRDAGIRARLANGEFDLAIAQLEIGAETLGPDRTAKLWALAVEHLVAAAGDAEFVRLAHRPRLDPNLARVSPHLRLAMAERLVALGFPNRASSIAPEGAMGTDGLFPARLARASGEVDEAIGIADDRTDPEARRFVADTLTRNGRHGAAHSILTDLDLSEAARDAAWRAGLWDAVASDGSDERGAAARAMRNAQVLTDSDLGETPTPPSLEAARSLLDESAALRDTIAALLIAVPPPGD